MNSSPAVVIKSKFIVSSENKNGKTSFKNYLNYMDRGETHAVKNEFESYQDYMSDKEKSTGLFTKDKDKLDEVEKEKYKEIFKKSQEKGSILWQDVVSFDNEWLRENGILKDKSIDEKKLQQATRSAMNEMLKKEGILDSAIWTAAIHYNTDNIHIHIATVQVKDFRERGKRKQSSIETMKSKVVNNIMDRSKQNEKLNDFIRNKVVKSKSEDKLMNLKNRVVNRDMVKQFKKIHSMLPEDKRLWKYNMNGISHVRPEIDKLTDMYINKYFKKDFKEFKTELDKEVELFKKTYGDSKKAEKYKETKMNDLYTRMGNTILKEIKQYDNRKNEIIKSGKQTKSGFQSFYLKRALNNSMYMMNRYMKDDLQSLKNQRAFEQLQREQEYER